jgi:flagellar M-ring protein FliF
LQDFFEKIIHNLSEFYGTLEPRKKAGMLGISAFIAVGLVAILIWASKTRYEVLYKNLNREDAKKIAMLLEESKVDFLMAEDGKVIKVPSDLVEKWRLNLAMKGVDFSGTLGYEVFDKQSFGTTRFVQEINRKRAIEGELVKTIKQLRGIHRARVHLTIPESSPFVSQKKEPSAAVTIHLEDGVTLTEREVKGIAMLVSSSVEGMRPENVVIVNGRGKRISDNVGDKMTAYTANRIELESKLNQQYARKVKDILEKVVGEGKAAVEVSIALDFTESVSTETKYDQENSAVLSEVSNSQSINGSRPSPQGIPGARSNIPGEQPQPGIPETKNDVKKNLSTKNYNVPSKVVKSKNPSSGIKKISIGVVIDTRKVPMVDTEGKPVLDENGVQKMRSENWSNAEIENFKAIISSAVGLNGKRGDSVAIKSMEFVEEDLETAERLLREKENRQLIKEIAKYVSVGLAISLFFLVAVRPFIQWITDNTVESVEDFLPRTLEELEKIQANQKLPGLEDALPQIEEKLNPEKIEGNMLREKIISLVENNPGKAAQIVHEMIHMSESDKQIA